jgi:hypothetical protein
MAFDENLAARIRTALARKKGIDEKKMFGGVGFLLHGTSGSRQERCSKTTTKAPETEQPTDN